MTRRAEPRRWWKLDRRSWVFFAILAIDLIILWFAWKRQGGSPNNDPAGNGMAAGFYAGIVAVAGSIVGVLALLFAVIHHRGARLALTWLLGLYTILLLSLLL